MSDYLYEGLSLAVRQGEDYAQFGVVIHGRFFPIAGKKVAGFLAEVAEARAAEQDQAQQQPPQA